MERNVYIYIIIASVISTLIRIIPTTLIRKQITNPFIRSFLYYVPYVTLAVMTFPAIIEATQNKVAGILALIVGMVAAWFDFGLFKVAISCCLVTFIFEYLVRFF